MKKLTYLSILLLMACFSSFSQVPESFNYQAALRNSSGETLAGKSVNIKINILQESETGSSVYSETHATQTNSNGIINLQIGKGQNKIGNISSINWGLSDYFLKIEIDENGGSAFVTAGVSQLLSVPYALHAQAASKLGDDNVYSTNSDTLFVVKDHSGNVVFAVFPDGAQVIVDESGKGRIGGFAVSGRNPAKAGDIDIFKVTPDSTRVFVNETAKGRIGGFAVSGRNPAKAGIGEEYLIITPDSSRIFFKESGKGRIGGFAVSGRNPAKANLTNDYFNVSGNTTPDVINNEPRVMWYPQKNALLAGQIYVASPEDVGQYSVSLGYRNMAKGQWSQAMGYQSIAQGPYATTIGFETVADTNSFAFGTGSKALGKNSFAFGAKGVDISGNVLETYTTATGDFSFAFGLGSSSTGLGAFVMGVNSTASGNFSTAMGFGNVSEGETSFTMGSGNTAGGQYSMALGANNQANGTASVTFGIGNTAGNYAIVGGANNTASGTRSFAIGQSNNAIGDGSIAAGFSNDCTQPYSVAFGSNNTSSGTNSFALGAGTEASGLNSSSFGAGTVASAENTLAAGNASQATAIGATAYGNATAANADYSFTAGFTTTAETYASMVIGQYNTLTGGQKSSWDEVDPLFIAGNGTNGGLGRNNALILFKNGNMTIAGTLQEDSDERLKKNIIKIDNVLPKILNINPVYFEFKNQETHPGGTQIGFIAQEFEPLFPELISKNSNGYLSVKYANVTAVLLQAIKEQQKIIETEKQKNKELESQINDINNKLKELETLIKNK